MALAKAKKRIVIPPGLLEKIASGDNYAFEELYRMTYKPLYAFILSMTMNDEDAKDLLQDTFIKVRGSCHLYKDEGNPMAWIMKISKNLFLMKCRQEASRKTMSLEEHADSLSLSFSTEYDSTDRVFIQEMFKYISLEDRNIIIMHVLMGLKHKEIGQMLGMPTGTVLSRYHRTMSTLKKLNS